MFLWSNINPITIHISIKKVWEMGFPQINNHRLLTVTNISYGYWEFLGYESSYYHITFMWPYPSDMVIEHSIGKISFESHSHIFEHLSTGHPKMSRMWVCMTKFIFLTISLNDHTKRTSGFSDLGKFPSPGSIFVLISSQLVVEKWGMKIDS